MLEADSWRTGMRVHTLLACVIHMNSSKSSFICGRVYKMDGIRELSQQKRKMTLRD